MTSCTNTTVRFQLRRATEEEWVNANPVLLAGEPAYSSDKGKLKIGNGTLSWAALTYINIAGISGATGDVGTPTNLVTGVFLTPNGTSRSSADITVNSTSRALSKGSIVQFTSDVTWTGTLPDKKITRYIYYYLFADYPANTTRVQVSLTDPTVAGVVAY